MSKRRDAVKMTDDEVREFLRSGRVMSIATQGPDGNVHLVAMWYSLRGDHPVFETFTKSQKVQNLRRDPRVSALVEAGDDYNELRGVEIVGKAIVHDDPEFLQEVAEDVVRKYIAFDGEDSVATIAQALARNRVAVEIVPEKIVSWDHRKISGTY